MRGVQDHVGKLSVPVTKRGLYLGKIGTFLNFLTKTMRINNKKINYLLLILSLAIFGFLFSAGQVYAYSGTFISSALDTGQNSDFITLNSTITEPANTDLNPEQRKYLDKIFTFNIAGRYADEKFEFYKKYNKKEYA